MVEIRFHGRGGQGAVTSAELLALAAIEEGKFAQAIPSFGPERRGAPVAAYVRISSNRIKYRFGIYNPDIVVVLDPSLLGLPIVKSGLKEDGILVVNTHESEDEIRERIKYDGTLATVDASSIAVKTLGIPVTNTCMLGALLKASKLVSLESFINPMKQKFKGAAEKNLDAMRQSYNETIIFKKRFL